MQSSIAESINGIPSILYWQLTIQIVFLSLEYSVCICLYFLGMSLY